MTGKRQKAPETSSGASLQQRCISQLGRLPQGFVHRIADAAVHALEDVAVGVQRLRYGGVPQELLDVLGVDVAGEQQRGAGVPEIVEADAAGSPARFSSALNERTTLRWDRGVPTLEGNTRP